MKGVLWAISLAVLTFAAAGCGSGHSAAITVIGTTTLSTVKTGTPITCKGGSPRVEVPAGQAAINDASGTDSPSGSNHSTHLRLTRHLDGSVTVSCTRK
jgi:hypothetical protein